MSTDSGLGREDLGLAAEDFHPGVLLLEPQSSDQVLVICGPVREESDAPDAEWYALSKLHLDARGVCTPARVRARDLLWSWTLGKDERELGVSGQELRDGVPWLSTVGFRAPRALQRSLVAASWANWAGHPEAPALIMQAEYNREPVRHPAQAGVWYVPRSLDKGLHELGGIWRNQHGPSVDTVNSAWAFLYRYEEAKLRAAA